MQAKIERIKSIDGLRAVAILIVIVSHLFVSSNVDIRFKETINLFIDGNIGVRLFFVISGFLITYLLLLEKAKNGSINFANFYIRRFLRISPVFYSYLFVLVVFRYFGLVNPSSSNLLVSLLYVENFHLVQPMWLTTHSWSLAVEEQFYFIWPAILKFGRIQKFGWKQLILVFVVGIIMRSMHYKYTELSRFFLAPFLMHADILFLGCYVGYQYFHHREKVELFFRSFNKIWLVVGIFILWFFTRMEFHPIYDIIFIPISAIFVGCICSFYLLYFIINTEGTFGKMLNSGLLTFIGKISYSLYVWQQLFLGSAPLLSNRIRWIAFFPQNIFLTFIAAITSFYVIEKPFLKIKEKIFHNPVVH